MDDFTKLAGDPRTRAVDVKKLQPKDSGMYRLRVGRWRAVFTLNQKAKTIEVLRVDDRRDAY